MSIGLSPVQDSTNSVLWTMSIKVLAEGQHIWGNVLPLTDHAIRPSVQPIRRRQCLQGDFYSGVPVLMGPKSSAGKLMQTNPTVRNGAVERCDVLPLGSSPGKSWLFDAALGAAVTGEDKSPKRLCLVPPPTSATQRRFRVSSIGIGALSQSAFPHKKNHGHVVKDVPNSTTSASPSI